VNDWRFSAGTLAQHECTKEGTVGLSFLERVATCEHFPIIKLEKAQLVDTNGAGDAYVGGFLAGLCGDKDVATCCKMGAYAASEIVQQSGCVCPAEPKAKFA